MIRIITALTRTFPTLLIAASLSTGASAVDVEKRVISRDAPALLVAEHVTYDDKNGIASAVGNVEIIQDNTILRADAVTYNLNTDKVTAVGNVSILQQNGDVFFADNVELTQKMQTGVVKNFQARMKGNSLFAARKGERINENVTKLDKLVYSPCKVCKPVAGEAPKAPLWQIQARKARIDGVEKRVTYRDAYFDVYGVPVIYTPYFSHPTPDAPSQSGILTPQFFSATDIGTVVKLPVYISLAPDMDATLTPWYVSDERPLLAGEFRKLFDRGFLNINGAITDTFNRDEGGNVIDGTQVRGYVKAHGRYQLSDYWGAGLDAERTTDNTFLQRYRFGWRDVLTSRAYAERIENRNYASVEALSFQGLTVRDDSSVSPSILPKARFHYESEPQFAHSRTTLDGSVLVTQRNQGASTKRFSGTAGWKIPYITRGGQVFEAGASLRGDVYDISDQTIDATTGETYNGTLGRVIPQLNVNWRYPLVRQLGNNRSLMIAPIAELAISPRTRSRLKLPNEDSQVSELNDTNLFSANRFTGLDQVESGARFTYGTRGHFQNAEDEWLEWLFGQTYQEDNDSAFPITNAPDPHFSDFIGRLGLKYKWFDIAYSFRLDRDSFVPLSNNVNMLFNMQPVSFDISYTSLRNDPIFGNRKEIFGAAIWDVTPQWQWSINARRDLGSNEQALVRSAFAQTIDPTDLGPSTVGLGSSLTYHNECVRVTASVGRSFISQEDVRPSTTFGLLVTLNNFGDGDTAAKNTLNGAGNLNEVETPQENAMPLPETNDLPQPRSVP